MENDNVPDGSKIKPKNSYFKGLIFWWEKKRLYYNLFLIVVVFLTYYGFSNTFETSELKYAIGSSISILFLANVFYTLGWCLGAIPHLLLNHESSNMTGRWVLFVVGTLVSMFLTLMITARMLIFG